LAPRLLQKLVFRSDLGHRSQVKNRQHDPITPAPAAEEAQVAARRLREERNEVANTLTHGIGLLLSLGGLFLLLYLSIARGEAKHIVSFAIYGTCLVLAYLASTIYHAARCHRRKRRLQLLDHCSIYLLIAGSYTPFLLVGLDGGGWGWSLFGVVWGIAIIGIAVKVRVSHHPGRFSTISYLLMGWLAIIAIKPLYDHLVIGAFILLVLGGVSYTVGVYFFAHDHKHLHHAVWHCFVLAGSVLHFLAVAIYLTP
jgi:hemolysin III